MRKVIVANIVSVDGHYEGPGKNVMALPMDGFFDAHNAERLRSAETMLLGRSTFELFVGYWPPQVDNPAASADEREISRLNNAIEKIVVSDTFTAEATGPWQDTTRIAARAEAHKLVAGLRNGEGGDIIIFGSRTLWNDLLAAGLVDELHLMVGPVVLGGGTRLFGDGVESNLRLIEIRRQEGSDNVVLRYDAQPAA